MNLLPCPFCGSETGVRYEKISMTVSSPRITCLSCCAAGPPERSQTKSTDAWNKRIKTKCAHEKAKEYMTEIEGRNTEGTT